MRIQFNTCVYARVYKAISSRIAVWLQERRLAQEWHFLIQGDGWKFHWVYSKMQQERGTLSKYHFQQDGR